MVGILPQWKNYLLIEYWNDFGSNIDLWEIATGKKLKTFTRAFIAGVSPDDRLVVLNSSSSLTFWDIPKLDFEHQVA